MKKERAIFGKSGNKVESIRLMVDLDFAKIDIYQSYREDRPDNYLIVDKVKPLTVESALELAKEIQNYTWAINAEKKVFKQYALKVNNLFS